MTGRVRARDATRAICTGRRFIVARLEEHAMMNANDRFQCYAQKIVALHNSEGHREMLSRLGASAEARPVSMEALFRSLTLEQHFELFQRQNRLAEDLYRRHAVKFSINVDNSLVDDPGYRARFLEEVASGPAPTIYEFTEIRPMPPPEVMNPVFRRLRELGKTSALDDFGTGFNGMTLFVDYDFDIVKVDRSLIANIGLRPEKAKVLSLLSEMIRALGKSHIVEGVETREELEALESMGFDRFQGYYFHKPELIEQLEALK